MPGLASWLGPRLIVQPLDMALDRCHTGPLRLDLNCGPSSVGLRYAGRSASLLVLDFTMPAIDSGPWITTGLVFRTLLIPLCQDGHSHHKGFCSS